MKCEIASATDIGRIRTNNQDRFLAEKGQVGRINYDALLVVADGMGGHAGGEVAAQMAIDNFIAVLSDPNLEESSALRLLEGAALNANSKVFEAASNDPNLKGMGTTFTAAAVLDDVVHIVHVGDSRAYSIDPAGQIKALTKDDSLVGEQVRAGNLSPEAAAKHPQRNVLTKALGNERKIAIHADSFKTSTIAGLVLCSDGLYGFVSDGDIAAAFTANRPADACQRLVELANSRGGPDNITVVIAKFPTATHKKHDAGLAKTVDGSSKTQQIKATRTNGWLAKAMVWLRLRQV